MPNKFYFHFGLICLGITPLLYLAQNCGTRDKTRSKTADNQHSGAGDVEIDIAASGPIDPSLSGIPIEKITNEDSAILDSIGSKDSKRQSLVRVVPSANLTQEAQEMFRFASFLLTCSNTGQTRILLSFNYYVEDKNNCQVEINSLGDGYTKISQENLYPFTGLNNIGLYRSERNWFDVRLVKQNSKNVSHALEVVSGVRTQTKVARFSHLPSFNLESVDGVTDVSAGSLIKVRITSDIRGRSSVFLDLDPGTNASIQSVDFKKNPGKNSTIILNGAVYNLGGNFSYIQDDFEVSLDIQVASDAIVGSKILLNLYRNSVLETYFKNASEQGIPDLVNFKNNLLEFTVIN